MITYYTNSFNINHQEFHDINLQDFYDSCLIDINIFSLECSCHHKGQFIKYGFYYRFVKTPHGVLKLKIQRLKCKHCNHTHSILLSSLIPYSQLLFHDMLSIIRAHSFDELDQIMIRNPHIDESNVSYIKKQFHKHWEQRLVSENIELDSELIFQCFFHFKKQFMQIKCTYNNLFIPTNIS